MSTRKRGIALAIIGVVAALIVALGIRNGWQAAAPEVSTSAIPVPADSINPDNEGRLVSVSGRLSVDKPPEDPQLGLRAADATILVREVEMLQWQEICDAGSCTFKTTWSPELIDSTHFSEGAEHRNPDRIPIASDRFIGEGVRLGAFVPQADLLVSSVGLTSRPVTLAELSNNLAASFSVSDGALVSGNDPGHPAVGDLRIRYQIVAGGVVSVTGIQQSTQLIDPAPANKP